LGGISVDTLDEVLRVNLHPALVATHAAFSGMKAGGWGHVINISSLTMLGSVERTSYAAAKAGDAAFMTGQTLHVDGGASIGKLFL
jgi:NAD(P)-dependent dehydrogenase (short-subunit alcohol dehydrogenase family)